MLKLCQNFHRFSRTYSSIFHILEPQVYTVNQTLKAKPVEKEIIVRGWVSSIRKHKNVTFFNIVDGTCSDNLQIVAKDKDIDFDDKCITFGSSIEARGKIVNNSNSSMQDIEMDSEKISLIGECNPEEYPFKNNKEHDSEYKRQFQHLRHRNTFDSTLLRIRHEAFRQARSVLSDQNFFEVQTPILTRNNAEGGGESFCVESSLTKSPFFGTPTYLSVSSQLHLEALCHAVSKVFTFSPTFRADHSKSRHHLAEFYMLEVEMAFCNDIHEVEEVVEGLLSEIVDRLREKNEKDLQILWKDSEIPNLTSIIDSIAKESYETMSYTQAVEILENHRTNFESVPKWGEDFRKEHEKFLVSHANNCPLFIRNYPAQLKPFYMKLNSDGKTVDNVDLLFPSVGEVCGGSVREEDFNKLKENMERAGLANQENFDWYLDIRKYGSAIHSGFGVGFDRFLQSITGVSNIKDVVPFPRSYKQIQM